MSRVDRSRLSQGTFPFRCEVATRFIDLDVQSHINNVAVAGIVQEGRARFALKNELTGFLKGRSLAVVSLAIEFVSEMHHPEPVEVSVGVLEVGRTSYRLGEALRQNGRIGAYAEIVLVAFQEGKAVPFDDEWRNKLESLKIGSETR